MEGTANIVRGADPLYQAARFVCEAVDFAPTGVAVVLLDGTCVTVNRTFAGWVRPALTVEEAGGFSLVAGDDGRLAAALRRAALGESVVVEDVAVQILAGRPVPFRIHVMPFRLDGSVQAASVVFEDRSEQALTVEAFEASERRFRSMVESADDGIAAHREGILLYVNPAAVGILGYDSADEIIGRSVLDFVQPGQQRQSLENLLSNGRIPPIEQTFVRKDGVPVPVEVSSSRTSPDLSGFLFMRDITRPGRRQAEAGARPRRVVRTTNETTVPASSVLICDDEPRLAALTAELLGQYGYPTRTVGSVDETIHALEQDGSGFGVVLLDVNLPQGSAGRVLERMQQIGCATPVILTSGYSVEDVASELLGDPRVVHFLAKPYPVEELVDVLSRVGP